MEIISAKGHIWKHMAKDINKIIFVMKSANENESLNISNIIYDTKIRKTEMVVGIGEKKPQDFIITVATWETYILLVLSLL